MKSAACRTLALALALALALLGGCATVPEGEPRARSDPWEPFNRGVFEFNDALDKVILKPVATAYVDYVPRIARTGVSNFLGNIVDLWSTINLFLQAKPQEGLEMWMRFASNTVFGVAGLFDPATEFGLERRVEDMGQTWGRWGMGSGPYLVLPFFGPSDVRDAAALTFDVIAIEPGHVFHTVPARNTAIALQVINQRASLFPAEKLLEGMALDRYTLIRDAYLARRRSLIHDGNPPDDEESDDSPPSQ